MQPPTLSPLPALSSTKKSPSFLAKRRFSSSSSPPFLRPSSFLPPPPSRNLFCSLAFSSSHLASDVASDNNPSHDLVNRCYHANAPYMKGAYGAGNLGNGALTLEPAPKELSKSAPTSSPLLDTGGDGGNSGRINSIGGGGNGSGDEDDDEYNWNNIEPEDDGCDDPDFLFKKRRVFVGENFAREAVDAVFSEWMKSMKDLPLGLKQAYTLGMLSSAQFTRFLWFNARPTMTRSFSRVLTEGLSRDFNGRMIADPSLPRKILLEIFSSVGFSIWLDSKQKGLDNMKKEWSLVLTNAVSVAACNAFVVWSLAPCYRYGNRYGFQWLNDFRMKLPNNAFESSYRFQEFTLQRRGLSFLYKSVNLFILGASARLAQMGVEKLLAKDNEEMGFGIANVGASAIGAGLSMGFYSNLRYQLLSGFDKGLIGFFDVMGLPLFFGSAARILNSYIGVQLLAWRANEEEMLPNLEHNSMIEIGDNHDTVSSKWYDIKSAVASWFALLEASDIQGESDYYTARTTKKKLTAGLS